MAPPPARASTDRTVDYPTVEADMVAWITESEMIEVDRVMIEDLGIELIQMMENAGRSLARLVLDRYYPGRVAVVAGSGGNGGGGLVAARHLANAGVAVTVTTVRPGHQLSPVPAHQFAIVEEMGLPVRDDLAECDVIVDAVIGYSLRGAPSGRSADLIDRIGDRRRAGPGGNGAYVVSLDTPSGVEVDTGATPGVAVEADLTMTLCLPKVGLRSAANVGDLYLADISVPPSVTAPLGLDAGVAPPCFGPGPILAVTGR